MWNSLSVCDVFCSKCYIKFFHLQRNVSRSLFVKEKNKEPMTIRYTHGFEGEWEWYTGTLEGGKRREKYN